MNFSPSSIPNKTARVETRYTILNQAILVVSLLTSPMWLASLLFASPEDYSFASSLILVPLLGIGCAIMLGVVTRKNPSLRLLLGTGILVRIASAGIYIWIGFAIYNAAVDAFHYWTIGLGLASDFTLAGWSVFKPPYWNTNLINNLCGLVSLVAGDALPTLFVIFSLAALWGGFFFYRAFCIAYPDGDRRLYGLLVMFLPSIVFWSSAIGKDALEQLFIGVTAYGFARLTERQGGRDLLICVAGLAGAILIRPHIGAMLTIACVAPYTFLGTRGHMMRAATKILVVPVLLVSMVYLIVMAGSFVGAESSDAGGAAISRITKSTAIGGSVYGESLPVRMAMSPLLIFRPLPWEVHGAMAAVASLEGFMLLVFCWKRRSRLKVAVNLRENPFSAFILIYAVEFSLAFAAISGNFGTLVRQRIMLVPIVLMLFCANSSQTALVRVDPLTQRFRGMVPMRGRSLTQRTEL